MRIQQVVETCSACPSQWEAKTLDNRPVYLRYRYGVLTINVGRPGKDMTDALHNSEAVTLYTSKDTMDGVMSSMDMMRYVLEYDYQPQPEY